MVDIDRFRYPNGNRPVLHNIHFRVPAGSKVGIVGPTGSGKTTLLRLLVRDFDRYDGRITVAGQDIRDLPLTDYRRQIGYTPQTDFLFSTSIERNLRFGDEQANDRRVIETARKVAMDQEIAAMTDQYKTRVGQDGTNLSGGQRQRLSLGRALIGPEQLLVLDDPLSAVDAETAGQIEERLVTAKEKTVIMTTSRLSTVDQLDWLIVMEAGTVTEQGQPAELLKRPGWYRNTLQEQLRRQRLEEDLNG
ncbi:ATP-binding cassette domain-containing protein [Limosilactobacillus sp.]|uniref:ATP-binding cassette domain-containing protein n=1 Tax=Limosilactobacillus sp. TaxID=2773925 RepID=UPI00345E6AD3